MLCAQTSVLDSALVQHVVDSVVKDDCAGCRLRLFLIGVEADELVEILPSVIPGLRVIDHANTRDLGQLARNGVRVVGPDSKHGGSTEHPDLVGRDCVGNDCMS